MSRCLILRLRSPQPRDWVACGGRLAELCARPELGHVGDAQLVRLGDADGMLLLWCAGPIRLKGAAEIVGPWLVEQGLLPDASSAEGDVVFELRGGARPMEAERAVPAAERAVQFAAAVARAEAVWGLYDETWARVPAPDQAETLPFWPSADAAAKCARGVWRTFAPRAIELQAFTEQWLPNMEEDGIVAAVCPLPDEPGTLVGALELAEMVDKAIAGDLQLTSAAPQP